MACSAGAWACRDASAAFCAYGSSLLDKAGTSPRLNTRRACCSWYKFLTWISPRSRYAAAFTSLRLFTPAALKAA
jgi:hypothetical protein